MNQITIEQAINAVQRVLSNKGHDWGAVSAEDSFQQHGLDSMDLAEVFLFLEQGGDVEWDPLSAAPLNHIVDLTKLQPFERR